MKNEKAFGYSLLELILVIVVGSILLSAVAANFAPSVVSLDIEHVAAQTAAALSRVRREALKGNVKLREFILKDALAAKHPGIALTEQAPASTQNCQGSCASGEQLLCVSGTPFCYAPGANFTFERSSGRLPTGRAIFIVSKGRKFAALVSPDGKTDIAELVNGEWKSRTELLLGSAGFGRSKERGEEK